MKKIKVTIDTGFCGENHEVVIDVEDDATEDEIDKYAEELVWEYINVFWKEI